MHLFCLFWFTRIKSFPSALTVLFIVLIFATIISTYASDGYDNHIQCHHADHSIIYIISLLSIDSVEDAPDKWFTIRENNVMLLLFFTLFSLFLFIFCLLCIFPIHFTYKFDDIPEHLWYNLENLITYLLRYQGQKVRKPMQACLQEDFWPLNPPKTFFQRKMSGLWMFLRIARVQST